MIYSGGMKANQLAPTLLCLLLMLALEGHGQGTNLTSAEKTPSVAAANNSTSVDDSTRTFNEVRVRAERGDAKAQCFLGESYHFGFGIAKNDVQAVKWWRKAAEQGDATAQFDLGHCYVAGDGVTKDTVEAIKWWRKAAEQGNVKAQFLLGVFCRAGEGAPRNYEEAAKWHQKAADQGLAEAQLELGKLYASGLGVPQNYQKAVELFRMAAEQGNVDAQGFLGFYYDLGQGVSKDEVEAYKWYNLAAAQGDTNAVVLRDSIANSMTPEQIAEAQRLSREFIPRKQTPGSTSDNSILPDNPTASGSGFFITDDGYLISNYHVVKDATKVRLLTSAGLIDAKVVQVDAANDLALLEANAEGRMKNEETFKPLPIAASRTVALGGTVATVGFPDPAVRGQGFAPTKSDV